MHGAWAWEVFRSGSCCSGKSHCLVLHYLSVHTGPALPVAVGTGSPQLVLPGAQLARWKQLPFS